MAKEQKNGNELKQAIISLSLETIRSVSDLDSSDAGYGDNLIGIAKQMREKSGKIIDDFSEAGETNGKTQDYQMVDLGLPSGLKWADRNIGAASPEVFGDYFMWGSVTPDTDNVCDWEHAPFNDGSSDFDEEYFNEHKSEWLTEDGTLKQKYDAAHAIMGDGWRMPTSVEIHELFDGTTQTAEGNGMRFTSKANGSSIFIPFAGYRENSGIYDVGYQGNAWSSSLDAVYAGYSHDLYFRRYGNSKVDDDYRCFGFVARGVHE